MDKTTTCINSTSFSFLRSNITNMCFMILGILEYEKSFILMEKMGKQYSQTPLKSPTIVENILCRGWGRVGFKFAMVTGYKLLLLVLNLFCSQLSPHRDFEIAILQDKKHYIRK